MATVTPALPRGDVFADASAASLGLDGPNASEDPWGVSVPQSGLGLLNGLDARAFAALHFWKPVQRLSEAQFADVSRRRRRRCDSCRSDCCRHGCM